MGRGLGDHTSLSTFDWTGSHGIPLRGGVSAVIGESRPSPPHVFEKGRGGETASNILGNPSRAMVHCGPQTEGCKHDGTVDRNGPRGHADGMVVRCNNLTKRNRNARF